MHEKLHDIHKHMQFLGRSSLAHALSLIVGSTDADSDYGYYQSELAVLMAAHAAEILLKSRIAEEHPLLIFDKIPTSTKSENLLEVEALFESGKTIQYNRLPERLWATTGYKLKNPKLYENFGKLRNNIQHFAPSENTNRLTQATLEFVFKVVDPFLQDFWGGYAVTCFEYPEFWDEHVSLFERLLFWEVKFIYPPRYEKMVQKARDRMKNVGHRGKDVLAQEEAVRKEREKHTYETIPRLWHRKQSEE